MVVYELIILRDRCFRQCLVGNERRRDRRKRLIVGDLRVPRISARYDPVGLAGRLTIDATPRATSTVSQDAEHITIKFDAEALDVTQPLEMARPRDTLAGTGMEQDPLG